MVGLAKAVTLAVAIGVVLATAPPSAATAFPQVAALDATTAQPPTPPPSVGDDPRVRAFLDAYRALVDSVAYGPDDVVFYLGARPIHFQDGRMLDADHLADGGECDSIFYRYALGPLTDPVPAPDQMPVYCTDLMESLWGRTETEVRRHGRSVAFLGHRLFVNEIVVEELAAVERELEAEADRRPAVAEWIADLDITYSFIPRDIAGSPTRSHHAWGLAVDFVPSSYEGRHVYWRWSRVFNRDGWDRIPIDERWSPPEAVIETFERHGFLWGGKWAHFDVMHFEYRPEVLLYNRLISGGA